jgi:hypothetical protein
MVDLSQSGNQGSLVSVRHDALSQAVTTLAQTPQVYPNRSRPDLASPSWREEMR